MPARMVRREELVKEVDTKHYDLPERHLLKMSEGPVTDMTGTF